MIEVDKLFLSISEYILKMNGIRKTVTFLILFT